MKKLLLSIVGLFGIFSFCSADGIYHNSSLGLISVVYDGSTVTLSDKNNGAVSVCDSSCQGTFEYIGYFYQRGNNYGFNAFSSISTYHQLVDVSSYGPSEYSSSRYVVAGQNDRTVSKNNNLRGDVTDTDIARKGPCPDGFHVPKSSEYSFIYNYGNSKGYWSFTHGSTLFKEYFYFPTYGYLNPSSNMNTASIGYFWSSSVNGNTAEVFNLEILNGQGYDRVDAVDVEPRNYGFNVRCFKNFSVEPDSTWSVITGDVIDDGPVINDPILRVNYGNTSYDYILTDNLEIRLNSPVLKDGDNYSYIGSTGINLFYNGSSQFYNKSELYLFTPSWYSANIFNPICL